MARNKETIYGAEKLARFFGVTKETARDWCKKSKLPGFKIGKEWKVRVVDLQRIIEGKIITVRWAHPHRGSGLSRATSRGKRDENNAPRLF
jgi:hypothetical protein